MTPHFTLPELIVTSQRTGNTPSPEVIANLQRLCETILEPARAILDRPLIITSGYRSPEVNMAVGGVPYSQHTTGQAADFIVAGLTPREVCGILKASAVPFHQLIFENFNGGWTHISWSDAPRHQAFELPSGEPL